MCEQKDLMRLVSSHPPPALEKVLLRIYADAQTLRREMTGAHANNAFLVLEAARDNLSAVIDRAEFKR